MCRGVKINQTFGFINFLRIAGAVFRLRLRRVGFQIAQNPNNGFGAAFGQLIVQFAAGHVRGNRCFETVTHGAGIKPFVHLHNGDAAFRIAGLYGTLIASPFGEMYSKTATMATQSIGPMILFCLGYDFRIDKDTIAPLAKLALVKTVYYGIVIGLFFLLFPALMADKVFMMAVIIYLMSPTGAGLVPVISPLFRDEDDAAFASAFIPLYLVITLIVYACVVIFIA